MSYPRKPNNTDALVCQGNTVYIQDGKFEAGMRKFKNMVRDSGLLIELRERESYKKPTTRRKEALGAAKSRDRKRLAKDTMPKRLF
jgi:ribosomal protein S21